MVKAACNHEPDNVCRELNKVFHDLEVMTSQVYDGLLKHRQAFLNQAAKTGENLEREIGNLTQSVETGQAVSITLDPATILAITGEVEKIRREIDKMVGAVRGKINEGILFSDKAVMELKDFFGAVTEGLRNAHDLVLTHNPVLVKHIVDNFKTYEEKGHRYAEEHQKRLIKGICLPKSSLVYLAILDSLKDILRSIRGIAQAFGDKR